MFGANLKATNSSFQKGITFCRSIYVKKVMKLLAFIFEQPSYITVNSKIVIRSASSSYNLNPYLWKAINSLDIILRLFQCGTCYLVPLE